MVNLICKTCGYRFSREKIVKECPYCDKERVSEEPNAQELLEEINSG